MAPFADADFDTDPDWEFPPPTPTSRTICGTCGSGRSPPRTPTSRPPPTVDTVAAKRPRSGGGISLRWIVVHMIEEYARHNGHADLIRERVDGLVGE